MALVNYMGSGPSSLVSFSGIDRSFFGSPSFGGGTTTAGKKSVAKPKPIEATDYEGYAGDVFALNDADRQFQALQRKGLAKYGNDLQFYYASPEYKQAVELQRFQVYNEKAAEQNKERGDWFESDNRTANTLGQFVLEKGQAGGYDLYVGGKALGRPVTKQEYINNVRATPNIAPGTDMIENVYYDHMTGDMRDVDAWADDLYSKAKSHTRKGGSKEQREGINEYLETVTQVIEKDWERSSNIEQINDAMASLSDNIPDEAEYALAQDFFRDAMNKGYVHDIKTKKATKKDVKEGRAANVGDEIVVLNENGGVAFKQVALNENPDLLDNPVEMKRLQDVNALRYLQMKRRPYIQTVRDTKESDITTVDEASGKARRADSGQTFWTGWAGNIYTDGQKFSTPNQALGQFEGQNPGERIVVNKKSNAKQIAVANRQIAGKTLRDVASTQGLPNVDPRTGQIGEYIDYGKELIFFGGRWQEAPEFLLDEAKIMGTEEVGWYPSPGDPNKLVPGVMVDLVIDNDDIGTVFSEDPNEAGYLNMQVGGEVKSVGDDTWFITQWDALTQQAQDLGHAQYMDESTLINKYGQVAEDYRKGQWGDQSVVLKVVYMSQNLSNYDLEANQEDIATTSQVAKVVSSQVGGTANLQNIMQESLKQQQETLEGISNITKFKSVGPSLRMPTK